LQETTPQHDKKHQDSFVRDNTFNTTQKMTKLCKKQCFCGDKKDDKTSQEISSTW
jgi:hypothetical protein